MKLIKWINDRVVVKVEMMTGRAVIHNTADQIVRYVQSSSSLCSPQCLPAREIAINCASLLDFVCFVFLDTHSFLSMTDMWSQSNPTQDPNESSAIISTIKSILKKLLDWTLTPVYDFATLLVLFMLNKMESGIFHQLELPSLAGRGMKRVTVTQLEPWCNSPTINFGKQRIVWLTKLHIDSWPLASPQVQWTI